MPSDETRVILIDDLRSFADGRPAFVARTSAAGVWLLNRYRDQRLDELWLDHDLGADDTIWPVVEVLERAAFDGRPFEIGAVVIHSANPVGVAKMAQALRHWGYRVTVAAGSAEVAYLDRSTVADADADADAARQAPPAGAARAPGAGSVFVGSEVKPTSVQPSGDR